MSFRNGYSEICARIDKNQSNHKKHWAMILRSSDHNWQSFGLYFLKLILIVSCLYSFPRHSLPALPASSRHSPGRHRLQASRDQVPAPGRGVSHHRARIQARLRRDLRCDGVSYTGVGRKGGWGFW